MNLHLDKENKYCFPKFKNELHFMVKLESVWVYSGWPVSEIVCVRRRNASQHDSQSWYSGVKRRALGEYNRRQDMSRFYVKKKLHVAWFFRRRQLLSCSTNVLLFIQSERKMQDQTYRSRIYTAIKCTVSKLSFNTGVEEY